jgi:hypothetical protein
MRSLPFSPLILLFSLCVLPLNAAKRTDPPTGIEPNSRIFVDSDNNFDVFLLAALQKKHVRLHLVSSAENADYVLGGGALHTRQFVATRSYAASGTDSQAAVKLTSRSGDIIWAYAVAKSMLFSRGNQSVAEACAKHLKHIVK